MEYIDLVLENGELVRIEVPSKFFDEAEETIENQMKIRGWWSPASFDECSATYLGMSLERVNMGRVIGIL